METVHQIASLIYGALCCFYLFFIIRSKTRHLKTFFKILPLLILLFCLIAVNARFVAPFHVKSPFYVPKLIKVTFGVIFSVIGDAYLVYPTLTTYGVAAFAVAQGFYVFTFSDDGYLFGQVRYPELASLVCIGLISTVLFLYLLRNFKCCFAFLALFYTILISFMVWSAVMQVQKYISLITVAGGAGACLFYISDVILSINLWNGPLPSFLAREFVMITYYVAQYLIVFSHIYND